MSLYLQGLGMPKTHAQKSANMVRFGFTDAKKRGIMVTPERVPAKAGGLGEISKTAPDAINAVSKKYQLDVMEPLLAPMIEDAKNNPFQDTGERYSCYIQDPETKTSRRETFKLLKHFEPLPTSPGQDAKTPKGTWVYAIQNDHYFTPFKTTYIWNEPADKTKHLGVDSKTAMFNANMLFDKAAAYFINKLDQQAEQQQKTTPDTPDVDFVMANDWMTGPVLSELPKQYDGGKLFMTHNNYDEPQNQATISNIGMTVPKYMARRMPFRTQSNPYTGQPQTKLQRNTYFSPLRIGFEESDVVIANRNYARTITMTDFAKGASYIPPLQRKIDQGKVADMHHGISDEYRPYNNPLLNPSKGFVSLKPESIQPNRLTAMSQFKAQNRHALQNMLGLKQDSASPTGRYTVMTWISRLDPNQKGFYLIMNEAVRFLKAHPNAQLILGGPGGNDRITSWIAATNDLVQKDPDLQGRLCIRNEFLSREEVVQMNAGSDFFLIPSLYEPYGLNQLEALAVGATPIGHGVDGLRSTVSDPTMRNYPMPGEEPDEKYGQTGILMAPVDPGAYRHASTLETELFDLTAKQKRGEVLSQAERRLLQNGLPAEDQAVIDQAQTNFRQALERAMSLAKKPAVADQVRLNGMHFLEEEHTWNKIEPRYEAAFDQAIAAHSQRRAKAGV
jgi:glycogen synthase